MFVVVGNEEKEMESMIYFEDNTYSSNQSSECECINCSCRKDEFIWRKVKIDYYFNSSFKLQINYTDITPMFYDKIRNVNEKEFVELINKRVSGIGCKWWIVESCWNRCY